MPLQKKFLKTKPVCKVTFGLSPEEARNAGGVHLVGDFNKWKINQTPMKQRKDGSFTRELDLDAGRDYRFRYLLDSGEWINDPAADAYCPCGFAGEDNSVVKT